MKEIKNWEAVIEKNGEDSTALPLPGCIIKGEIDSQDVRIEATQINLNKLMVTDNNGESYLLYGAKDSYLGILNNMIEIGKDMQIDVQPIELKIEDTQEFNKGEI